METDMPCPKNGTTYVKIGDKRICPKCGHIAGYRQIKIAELVQENERLKERIKELESL